MHGPAEPTTAAAHLRGAGFHRLDTLRGDPAAIGPHTRIVTVSGSRALLRDGHPLTRSWRDVAGAEASLGPVLLGEHEGARYAAVVVDARRAEALERETGGRFESLRTAGSLLPDPEAGLLFYAAGLLAWHERSLRCGRCGEATRAVASGHRRECTAHGCGEVSFPRTDPAIITLLRRGDRALLVRQPSWPAGRFSTLAGFVEPGESLEQAIAREVDEEVGLPVERTAYYASQPWPFPHSLMIGFRTHVGAGEVRLGDELDDARWFTRDQLRAILATGELSIPPPFALSRSLIEDWLEE